MKKIIESLTPPENVNVVWLDLSGEVETLKVFNNGEWKVVNDYSGNNQLSISTVLAKLQEELAKKVDKEENKSLMSTEEKTKLAGIAANATRVLVDTTIKDSTNAVLNSAVKQALDNKANNTVFSPTANGLVPKANTSLNKSTAVINAEGSWIPTYNSSTVRTLGTFLGAPATANGVAEFRNLDMNDLPESLVLDTLTYGVSWDYSNGVSSSKCTRIGNMYFHKTLPIQNGMKGCVIQMKDGTNVLYYLDPNDWRWIDERYASNSRITANLVVTGETPVYTMTNAVFSTYKYEHQWLKIKNTDGLYYAFRVMDINVSTTTATLVPDPEEVISFLSGLYEVQLGAVLNGYDGEVMVEVPEFWIKSKNDTSRKEVRISPYYIDNTWEHQPAIYVAAYHDTVKYDPAGNEEVVAKLLLSGYIKDLPMNSALSICNYNKYCRGGAGNGSNASLRDSDLWGFNSHRSHLGKPRTALSRAAMRNYCKNSGKQILSYLQYKRILYWLFVIEYANFNSLDDFYETVGDDGCRRGGLGQGVTTVDGTRWSHFNGYNPLTPNGYTNDLGNHTGVKPMTLYMPKSTGVEPTEDDAVTVYVPRWHGIENPFGDIWNNVDGIIINSSSIEKDGVKYSEVYVTEDLSNFNDTDNILAQLRKMYVAGTELNQAGWTKELYLGDTAEIIPIAHGGNNTIYKCDHHWVNLSTGLRTLFLGGDAYDGGLAGLGFFASCYGVAFSFAALGFRSSCLKK